jgi:PAS domain S-box-containing protein
MQQLFSMKTINQMQHELDLPVLIPDHQGLITYVNQPFNAVFGWNPDEIIGHTLEAVIPKSSHDSHHLG